MVSATLTVERNSKWCHHTLVTITARHHTCSSGLLRQESVISSPSNISFNFLFFARLLKSMVSYLSTKMLYSRSKLLPDSYLICTRWIAACQTVFSQQWHLPILLPCQLCQHGITCHRVSVCLSLCPSVCLSVRPSQVGVVQRWLNLGSH